MPRRERQAALLPRRLILVAATAAAAAAATTTTVGRWPPGTRSSGSSSTSSTSSTSSATTTIGPASSSYLSIPEEPAVAVPTPARRRAWGAIPRSLISGGRRRGPGRYPDEFVPLWVRARGGAVGKKRFPQLGEEEEKRGADVDEDGSRAGEEEEEEKEEEEEEKEEEEEEEEEVAEEVGDGPIEEDHDEDSGSEELAEGREGSPTTTAAAGSAAAGEASILETLDLKTVLPLAIKQGAFFLMARWLGKNLSPEVESQVRAARAIYTAYLIFSQGLCMYIRYLIWKRNDDTEMELPPPAQLKSLMQEAGKAGAAAPAETGAAGPGAEGGLGGAASTLGPMLDKMMTSKMAVKKYDMKTVQGMRRGQFWASLIMCYTHLKRGMIKPMMLQVSFGLLSLLDSPLFHIYVLGRKAEGNLARPYKKQGLMASLSGPMEAMAAKAAAAEKTAAQAEADKAGGGGGGVAKEEGSDEDDGGEMPGIEVLSDADEDRAAG